MTKTKAAQALTYRDSVMIWGNRDPWKQLGIRLNHKTNFKDADVVRDGMGNILDMPLMPRKLCHGRPEVFFRHGKRTRKQRLRDGRIIDAKNHQCARCPLGVWESCGRTAMERVNSDPAIRKAFEDWRAECEANHQGAFVCTGSASWPWGRFKEAIAARGPFESSNDNALRKFEEEEEKKQRAKWVRDQRLKRERQREAARDARELPSRQFVLNVRDERDRRRDQLHSVLGLPGQSRSRSQVHAKDAASTAVITANAWAVGEIMKAAGVAARPGSIARVMAGHGLSAGVSRATLNARIKNDLIRADGCITDGIWSRFNPDADLEVCLDEHEGSVDGNLDSIADLEEAWGELRTPSDE